MAKEGRAIQTAMPKMLTNGEKTRDEQIADIVAGSTRETAWRDMQALRSLVGS